MHTLPRRAAGSRAAKAAVLAAGLTALFGLWLPVRPAVAAEGVVRITDGKTPGAADAGPAVTHAVAGTPAKGSGVARVADGLLPASHSHGAACAPEPCVEERDHGCPCGRKDCPKNKGKKKSGFLCSIFGDDDGGRRSGACRDDDCRAPSHCRICGHHHGDRCQHGYYCGPGGSQCPHGCKSGCPGIPIPGIPLPHLCLPGVPLPGVPCPGVPGVGHGCYGTLAGLFPNRPLGGVYGRVYAVNPYYHDFRDGAVYAAQGYNAPISVPLAPNVEHTWNYGWGIPSSRMTPVGRTIPSPYAVPPTLPVPPHGYVPVQSLVPGAAAPQAADLPEAAETSDAAK